MENYDPFTGSKILPKKSPPFRKKSKAYEKFKSLVYSKGWLSPDSVPKLPAREDDEELKGFLEKYHFKRSQIRTKFNEVVQLTATTNITPSRVDDVEESPVYISLIQRAP